MPQAKSWGKNPRKNPEPVTLDTFVKGGERKHLNLSLPAELHTRIKVRCAVEGRDMTSVVLEVLEERFPR